MPSRTSSRTGRTTANSTIAAPLSLRLSLDMIDLLRASGRGWRERASSDARSRRSRARSGVQLVDDFLVEVVDGAAKDEDDGHDEDGDAGDEDAVLDHRGALVVVTPGGDPRLQEGDDAQH